MFCDMFINFIVFVHVLIHPVLNLIWYNVTSFLPTRPSHPFSLEIASLQSIFGVDIFINRLNVKLNNLPRKRERKIILIKIYGFGIVFDIFFGFYFLAMKWIFG